RILPPRQKLKPFDFFERLFFVLQNCFFLADELFLKQVRDNRGRTYFRAIISDSKLSKTSPWTPNQKSELINVFRDNPNKKFIEFEVRTIDSKLPKEFQGNTNVRIHREDVYKIISDGDNIKIPPFKMNDINFKD
ncbi:hypothetical protein ACQ1Q1_06185, partial [Ornithobacterium rhinotracheale]